MYGTTFFTCLYGVTIKRDGYVHPTLGFVTAPDSIKMGLHGCINGLDDLRAFVKAFSPIYSYKHYLSYDNSAFKKRDPEGSRDLKYLMPYLSDLNETQLRTL